jgi:hypothetical protein
MVKENNVLNKLYEDKIKNFLDQLQNKLQRTSELEIYKMIENFSREKFGNNLPEILRWELIAFAFCENYLEDRSEGEPYFTPIAVFENRDGKTIEFPSSCEVNTEIISYWENRAKESEHPIFKARYSNLVWYFSEKIKGKKPHYLFGQIFIDSVIEIAEKDLHSYQTDTIAKLGRALSIAVNINDKSRIDKLIDTIINYEDRVGNDDKLAGLWGFSYEFLVKNRKIQISRDKEQKIIKDLEERFRRLSRCEDYRLAKFAALPLADYYYSCGEKLKAKNILVELGDIILGKIDRLPAFLAIKWLEELYHIYKQYGQKDKELKDKMEGVSIKVGQLRKKMEFKPEEYSIDIPREEIGKFINCLIDGDLDEAVRKVADYYVLKRDNVIQTLDDLSKKSPFTFLFPRKIFDKEGRPVAEIPPLRKDNLQGDEMNIIWEMAQMVFYSSSFLWETLLALISKFKLDADTIINYLYESPIFDEERKEFFVRGIKAYLEKDFLVALHILVPQIENLIRNLAENIGVPILKVHNLGGFNYRTLDDLLRDERIIKTLSEDLCLYFRVLFTHPGGLNIRNNICHGISPIKDFNSSYASLVFHALLCLSVATKELEKENEASESN